LFSNCIKQQRLLIPEAGHLLGMLSAKNCPVLFYLCLTIIIKRIMDNKTFCALKKLIFTLILSVLILKTTKSQSVTRDSLSVARFGKVYVYKQSVVPGNIVIMISGDAGWKYGVIEFAKSFAEKNTVVVGVDILRYYKELRSGNENCFMVASDFVELATAVERKYNFTGYIPPVIMGYSSGATLVYGILAQARAGTFIGGISLGFCPEIDLPKKLCQTNGLSEKIITNGKSYLLQPDSRLGNPWIVLQGKKDKICNFDSVADFVKKTIDAEFIPIPETGHDFSKLADFMPKWKAAYNKLITKYLEDQSKAITSKFFGNIPFSIIKEKVKVSSAPAALFFSGDGGWFSFEQAIAERLGSYGIPTIGIDTKKYFWNRKTPEKVASDMTEILNYYGKEWGKTQFIIIGYSQGAEIVPFLVTRFPDYLKSKIVSVLLLSPETTTDFEIHITNMLGLGSRKNTYSVIDEINKLLNINTICIFGENEKSPVPNLLKGTSVKIVVIPGDHHYKNNTEYIVKTFKENNAF
jgi:type IV secretory pathway VirJ component